MSATNQSGVLDPRVLEVWRENFSRSFYWACVAVFESQFQSSWLSLKVHKPLCDLLQNYEENTRLGVILPRDWLKSTVCSVYYPVWRAMLDTNFTCMIVLNTYTNATKKLSAIRALLQSNPILRAMYPERMPTTQTKLSAESITLPRTSALADATFTAAGVSTDLTSRHVMLIVEDDTIAPEYDHMTGEVCEPSADQVEKAIGFHKSAEFLLHDLKKSMRLVVGTRWRELDLFTSIKTEQAKHLKSGIQFRPYKFYELAVRMKDGHPDNAGDLVYPERFDEEVLGNTKATVGDYMYQALMMNSPMNAKDCLFNENDIRVYEAPPSDLLVFTTVDPAPQDSTSTDPDYNIVLTAGISESTGLVYVLDYYRARCNPGELIDEIFKHVEAYKPLSVGIESVAYQKTLVWWLKEMQIKRKTWFPVEEVKTSNTKKVFRIRGLQPILADRRLFILSWMKDLRQELTTFPRGAHDDIIDALSMQLGFWRNTITKSQKSADSRPEKFTADYILREMTERSQRPKNFPDDVLGLNTRGELVRDSLYEWGSFSNYEWPEAFKTRIGLNNHVYLN